MGATSQNKGKGSSAKEDEMILQDFSRRVSTKSSALFYGNGFIVALLPIWLFWKIYHLDPLSTAILYVVMTAVTTWLMALAYKNTKVGLKHKVAVKREAAVTKEMSKLDADKKSSRKEKDDRVLWKKNEVAEYESTTFSIFFNNAMFLAIFIFLSFYVLKGFGPTINYVLSIGIASGLVALVSTGTHA